jgi:hypothetical protein
MKEQIDLLTNLAVNARDYVKRVEIAPIGNYIDFGDGLKAYCTDDYSFFSMYYDGDTRLTVHNLSGKDQSLISFNSKLTIEDLQTSCDRAFSIIFDYEKNQADVLEKQKIAQIAELEFKLAKLRDL